MDQRTDKMLDESTAARGAAAVTSPVVPDQRADQMPEDELRILIQRITARMTALNIKAKPLSRRAGLGDTYVHNLLKGGNKKPSVPKLKAIAKALDCDLSYLIGEQAEPRQKIAVQGVTSIPVVGVAEAGAFRKMLDFDQEVHTAPRVYAAKSKDYPEIKHFALTVRGDSMDNLEPNPIKDGMVLLCVDFVDAELEIESGKIYAVRRTIDDGQTYECTVKRAMVFKDRYELRPASHNPGHDVITIWRDNQHIDTPGTEIVVIGLVYNVQFSPV